MSTTWNNLLLRLGRIRVRVSRPVRRKSAHHRMSVETLENRALLSASGGMLVLGGPAANEAAEVCVTDDGLSQQVSVSHTVKKIDQDGPGQALKFAQLKQHAGQAKVAVADFSGSWDLGVNGEPISNDTILTVQQVGKKVVGAFTGQNGQVFIAAIRGRVRGDQMIARLELNPGTKHGRIVLTKTDADKFEGTLVYSAGELLLIESLEGQR